MESEQSSTFSSLRVRGGSVTSFADIQQVESIVTASSSSSGDFGASAQSSSSFAAPPSSDASATRAQAARKTAERERPIIFDDSSTVNEFFFTIDPESGNAYGLFALLASFFLGSMGWHYIWVLLMAWSITLYCFQQTKRKHRKTIFDVKAAMQDPDVARRIMGPYLPGWVTFARVEKSHWLQDIVNNLWPNIAAATRDSIVASLNPLLDYYCPRPLLTSLTMGNCDLGPVPIVIDGIQTHRADNDTTIDLYFHWKGNTDIRVIAKALGVEVVACICNLHLQGVLRIFLGPHCNAWPCFGCYSMCFVGKPLLDFDIKAAKIPLEAIPGLSNWLDGFLRYTLSWQLVYPKRLVFPIFADAKSMKLQEATVDPIGRLCVNVQRAERLPEGFFQTRRTYVEGKRTNGDQNSMVIKRTKSQRGKNPIFNEELVFTVYNAPNERIELTVYTDEIKPPMIGNFLIADNVLGVCTIAVSGLLTQSTQQHPSMRLVNPKKTTHNFGYLTFETTFTPFLSPTDLEVQDVVTDVGAADAVPGAMSEALGGKVGEAGGDGSPDNDSSASPSSRASRGRSTSHDSYHQEYRSRRSASLARLRKMTSSGKTVKGVLLVNLVCCSNLPKVDTFGSADPYVKFRVGESHERTEHIKDTLNPKFDLQKQLDVADVLRDVLDVEVHDWDKIKLNKRLMCKTSVPLREVFEAGCAIRPHEYQLDPKGTITLGLRLMINQ